MLSANVLKLQRVVVVYRSARQPGSQQERRRVRGLPHRDEARVFCDMNQLITEIVLTSATVARRIGGLVIWIVASGPPYARLYQGSRRRCCQMRRPFATRGMGRGAERTMSTLSGRLVFATEDNTLQFLRGWFDFLSEAPHILRGFCFRGTRAELKRI